MGSDRTSHEDSIRKKRIFRLLDEERTELTDTVKKVVDGSQRVRRIAILLKELQRQLLHHFSRRSAKPIREVNYATMRTGICGERYEVRIIRLPRVN
ncbi:MAG: hypothetical protein H6822_20710 [Planctomycetaceae bacterium]|nr:hypothetical protein [Planctomycetales bacterium]MCB9924613.1 hypothetical protein [Planctomycetaceae bacterium]